MDQNDCTCDMLLHFPFAHKIFLKTKDRNHGQKEIAFLSKAVFSLCSLHSMHRFIWRDFEDIVYPSCTPLKLHPV